MSAGRRRECWARVFRRNGPDLVKDGECWGEVVWGGARWAWYACEGHRNNHSGPYIQQPAVLALSELGRTET